MSFISKETRQDYESDIDLLWKLVEKDSFDENSQKMTNLDLIKNLIFEIMGLGTSTELKLEIQKM